MPTCKDDTPANQEEAGDKPTGGKGRFENDFVMIIRLGDFSGTERHWFSVGSIEDLNVRGAQRRVY